MPRKGRQPTPEERALWRHNVRDAEPVERPKVAEDAKPAKPTATPAQKPKRAVRRAPVPVTVPPAPPKPPKPTSGLDKRTEQRLLKGKRDPDARLDLHGMSAQRAHAALKTFIADSRDRGLRCVLVITGKGSDEPADFGEVRPGVLRRETPRWLSTQPLASMVVTTAQAHPKHGGGGALYVYLKRKR